MQVQRLLKLLVRSIELSREDTAALLSLIEEYPYFYLAHALLAKTVYKDEKDIEKYEIQRAATYAVDRRHLRAWLGDKVMVPHLNKKSPAKLKQELNDIPVNNHLELISKKSLKKSTNEVSVKQFSIIDSILNNSLQFDSCVEIASLHKDKESPSIDLSDKDMVLDKRFATETLANIMVKQKKYKRAIEIYEHLILKYPEKKTYLNDIISKLYNNL